MSQQEKEKFTKYEVARILGARALQIAMDAPLLLKISKEKLEEVKYDPLKISELEFNAKVLPITVRRPLPKKLEARLKREKEEKLKETEEKAEEEEVEKIKEEGEIMELVQPEEEAEEEEKSEEGGGEAI